MNNDHATPRTVSPPTIGERVATAGAFLSGAVLVVSIAVVMGGSLYQPGAGVLAAVLADRWALFWITLASTAHLVLVPCICIVVALRDHRRSQAGIPVPEPRSVWTGHERVFGGGTLTRR